MAVEPVTAIAEASKAIVNALNNAVSIIFDPKLVKIRAENKRLKKASKAINYGQKYIRYSSLYIEFVNKTFNDYIVNKKVKDEAEKYTDKLKDIEDDFYKVDN